MLRSGLIVLCLLTLAACTTTGDKDGAEYIDPVPELRPGVPAGYLSRSAMPNSLFFLPPPPEPGSAAWDADVASSETWLALMDTPRREQAAADVDLNFPNAARHFQCEVGVRINETDTPKLYLLLRRSMIDAGLATYTAKNHYKRQRPFQVNGKPTCTPETEAGLVGDGSYPSGHAALGWAWSLILSSIAPEQADAIIARGIEFGNSRAVCNVHWQSDVEAGRLVGAAAVTKLHRHPRFISELNAAEAEVTAAREQGLGPDIACDQDD